MKYKFKTDSEKYCYYLGYWEGYKTAMQGIQRQVDENTGGVTERISRLKKQLGG